MNSKTIVGAVVILGVAAGGGYAYKTYVDEREAAQAEKQMLAEVRCDGLRREVEKIAEFSLSGGTEIGGPGDTPESWQWSMENLYPKLIDGYVEDKGFSPQSIKVTHAMIPYVRDMWIGGPDSYWKIGRKVCLDLEMGR